MSNCSAIDDRTRPFSICTGTGKACGAKPAAEVTAGASASAAPIHHPQRRARSRMVVSWPSEGDRVSLGDRVRVLELARREGDLESLELRLARRAYGRVRDPEADRDLDLLLAEVDAAVRVRAALRLVLAEGRADREAEADGRDLATAAFPGGAGPAALETDDG